MYLNHESRIFRDIYQTFTKRAVNEKMDPSLTLCTEVQTALEESQAFQFFPTQKPSLESFWQRILNSFFCARTIVAKMMPFLNKRKMSEKKASEIKSKLIYSAGLLYVMYHCFKS